MAKIEDLIAQIPDERLRKGIAAEVKALKKSKKFGLVFEEHLPETVRLPRLPVKVGDLVALKRESGNQLWRVTSIKKAIATCDRAVEGYAEAKDANREFPVTDLVVVRNFGDPIYPALVPVDRVERGGPDKPWHVLINADNFHALQLLLYCYAGKVDVIYIDPPYNTGARDWRYNNDYVDDKDVFRHSKWLSMMKKRLLLAKRLLKPDGVLIVTIDEHEVSNLGVLLRQINSEARVQMVTIVTNTAGSMSPGLFSRADEYAYFSFFGTAAPVPLETDLLSESKPTAQYWFPLFRSRGLNDRPSKRPNLVYPIGIDPVTKRIVGYGRSLKERIEAGEVKGDYDHWRPNSKELVNGKPAVWPFLDTGELTTWQVSGEALLSLAKDGFVRVRKPRDGNKIRGWTISYVKKGNRRLITSGAVTIRGREPGGALILEDSDRTSVPKSTWKVASHDARLYGSTMLRNLLGTTTFTYPKSPYAVKDCIRAILGGRKDGIILDFFAGSGTTFQAVAMINASDQGTRRCILVTNNEVNEDKSSGLARAGYFQGDEEFEKHGIAESIAWPRCRNVITGKNNDGSNLSGAYLDGRALSEGFNENLEFFRLAFLDPTDVARGDAFQAILPILWMMAGCQGAREDSKGSQPWFIPKHAPFAVLIKEKEFRAFRERLSDRKNIGWVFLVTDSEENFALMRRTLGSKVECVQLYKSYLENFRLNTPEALGQVEVS
ncbi:MAG: site-specific DNA-methyltransferase [Nitrospira sp.]|nr:site-specific DNA-methyltransferase [Nitrospira sp.]